ncbi:ATP-binding protein [Massilia sp. DJPM01]|uniref:hybrid sensor histidine kinase/response regulator n=1 Tax=Massilia sp. DJPM01 TaxID=3024404 RepID=UPI00259D53E5|nr:ATP-binding protein [Massilia sp. DJPM01]
MSKRSGFSSNQRADVNLAMRAVEIERDDLLAKNRLLCGANENLVLATIDAQNLRLEAERANQRQNEFLAMLAHELRNPLAPISMASSMLAKTYFPSAQLVKIQNTIDRQINHLSRLLDDLLDAARINSGKITLMRSSILLADQLRSAIETIQLRISQRNQSIELYVPSEDILLFGDPVRLAQAFSNLLVNASKFTPDGGKIVVNAWVNEDTVVITVADNGAGISSDVLPHIFSLFTQGPRALARSEGGLGIGLNVVRNVIELHAGTVKAESAGIGQGTVFTVTLPMPIYAESPVIFAQELERGPHRHRILLVEDNPDTLDMLAIFLRSEGYQIVTASDGVQGLEIASVDHYDVLVCDIGLPGMDGYELIRRLREKIGSRIPFSIAVSGYGRIEDRKQAIAAGFDRYMVKPIDLKELVKLLDSVPVHALKTDKGDDHSSLPSNGELCN